MSKIRKTKKKLRQHNGQIEQKTFALETIKPLTSNQQKAFNNFSKNHLFLHGVPGTGKTLVAMYLGLRELEQNNSFKKLVIFRSIVSGRDIGHLPGNHKEKSKVYEDPYYIIAKKLYNRGDAYDILKSKYLLEFHTTSFARGITLDNCIVLVDECQNLGWQEIFTIITRIGENCKIIFCGDIRQTDLNKPNDKSGLKKFMSILKQMKSISCIEFGINDIVRSDFVKEFIIACEKHDATLA